MTTDDQGASMQRRFQKSIRVPVRIKNGVPEFLYDKEFPLMREGAVGDVVFEDESVVEDLKWRSVLNEEEKVFMAPGGTMVLLAVNPENVPLERRNLLFSYKQWLDLTEQQSDQQSKDYKKEDSETAWQSADGRCWVEVCLTEDLHLRLRGERPAQLCGGACHVPALEKLKKEPSAPSLNQALGLILRRFEPKRKSTQGDVFRDGMILLDHQLLLLGDVRDKLQAWNEVERWKSAGLDPKAVKDRTLGGMFAVANEG
jgi:hypothetical protein